MLELLKLATLILNVWSSKQILIYNKEVIVILFGGNFYLRYILYQSINFTYSKAPSKYIRKILPFLYITR